jgi:hypothetical protein
MTHDQWVALFAPALSVLIGALGLFLAAMVTGLLGQLKAYFEARGNASAAQAVAAASAVIQPALMTGASTIAGKIARGELDYTNRVAIAAEATREVGLLQARIPGMIAVAAPVAGALVASMMAKVDAQMVASPTPLAAQVSPAA